MPAMIFDGQSRFGVSLSAFYRRDDLVSMVGRRGVMIPPITEIMTTAEPALAYVNALPDGTVRWVADCPDCTAVRRSSAAYVWLSTPLFFCTRCANRGIGSRWRPVRVPAERAEIERLLLRRPDPETRNWVPGETLADLYEQNVTLGLGE